MIELPQYSELHVVSDLHLGGETPKRQIFNQGKEFENLVDILLKRPKKVKQALLINGDLVDFLAEPTAPAAPYFDPAGAADKLDRILRDPSFVAVWVALRKFIQAPNRTLIITLGNHDLELSLPWVRAQLLQELAGGDATARARIIFAFEKEGYRCHVGAASVLCVHGNEVDPWNVTDYEQLRKMGQSALPGTTRNTWTPNGGTKLVIDVMNEVKKKYPFVDLLKPEEGGVIPTLLVLDPKLTPKVGDAIPSWLRSRWDQIRIAGGFLGEEELELTRSVNAPKLPVHVLGRMLGETFGAAAQIQHVVDLDDLLQKTEDHLRKGVTPLQLLGRVERPEYLGIAGAIWNMVRLKGRSEVLREALEKLGADRSYQLGTADDTYQALDKKISPDIDFLVSGHTHLERVLHRSSGGGHYFNSGTWVRLIQLTDRTLGNEAEFSRIYKAFESGSMDALDNESGLVLRRPTVVSFWADEAGTYGELRHVNGNNLEPQMPSRRIGVK